MDLKGSKGTRRYGRGKRIEERPRRHVTNYRDFSRGLELRTLREGLPEGATPFAQDMVVTSRNRIRLAPGTTLVEAFGGRRPSHILLHGSLDFTAELVFFDAPFLGVKRTDATQWLDIGLDQGPYAWTNFGGTLIFTDGSMVYAREPNQVEDIGFIPEAPVAQTYASWAGRVWAGAPVLDGNFEPIVLQWSAANSDYRDWTGLGSGFEPLIDEITAGDRIIALKPMGLDFMAIFLRNSIWLATRTGLRDRPGDLKSRVSGAGAVRAETCQTTQYGVVYLSDSGVRLFDGNEARMISAAINGEILPLNYERLEEYRATYDLMTGRYFLHVPSPLCRTYIYELEEDRWLRFSNPALDSVLWPVQVPWLRWMDLIGSWGEQEPLRWVDYGQSSEGKAEMHFIGDLPDDGGRVLEKEDPLSGQYFGRGMEGIWEFRPISDSEINKLITMKEFNVEYVGQGRLIFWAPNIHGVYEPFALSDLPLVEHPDVAVYTASKTGRVLGLQLRCCTHQLEILQVQLHGQLRSKRVEKLVALIPVDEEDPEEDAGEDV